ncbi:MAG: hypothetical protein WDN49_00730 [Acetobacteraceae bacterium]
MQTVLLRQAARRRIVVRVAVRADVRAGAGVPPHRRHSGGAGVARQDRTVLPGAPFANVLLIARQR